MADPKNFTTVVPFENDAGQFRMSAMNAPISTYFMNGFHVGTTDSAVVSGIAGQTIKIYAINLTQSAAGATKWTSGGTDLQGITIVGASAGYVMSVNPPAFLLKTISAGRDLELALSGTISAGGWVNGWTE